MKTLMKYPLFLLTVLLLSITSCHKDKLDPNGLPPTTQEGKNTLGFLLNGKPWTPKGFNGTANLSVFYDPSYRGGTFDISCYNRPNNKSNNRQAFGFYADSIQGPSTIFFGSNDFGVAFYDNWAFKCNYSSKDSLVKCNGYCKITKLDKVAGIFSGVFAFTLIKLGCDTIKITKGRFDMKLQ